jgi:nitric-oxide synthase
MRLSLRNLLPARARYTGRRSPLEQRLRRLSSGERREEARAFLELFHAEGGGGARALQRRWAEVRRQLRRRDFYEHTPEELAFGARVAWRNHGRCVGRLYWESLEVVDCRSIAEPDGIAEQSIRHLGAALGDGRIRSMISIFPPVEGRTLPAWIESAQITQYAGHVLEDGTILGDRQNVEATRIARSLGWRPEGAPGRFDMLPLLIRDRQDRRSIHPLPASAYREVPILHPEIAALGTLGLRWYAVPCVSGMILTIGGIDYPCAPFNGFYMCTEIASRDFTDTKRFDLLEEAAGALGIDLAGSPFGRDQALTELNRAVLASFRGSGVTMIDHHTASDQFMEFHGREQSQGRRVAADWRWVVPPQASSACEVFHLRMRNFHPTPNYYTGRAIDGFKLMPFYGDRRQNLMQRSLDRISRRLKLWRRMPW